MPTQNTKLRSNKPFFPTLALIKEQTSCLSMSHKSLPQSPVRKIKSNLGQIKENDDLYSMSSF